MNKVPKGFTFPELLVVVSIISILAWFVIPVYQKYVKQEVARGTHIECHVKDNIATCNDGRTYIPR